MDSPIEWNPDGSIVFTAGGKPITWAAPTFGTIRHAKNEWATLVKDAQADVDDPDSDIEELLGEKVAHWVRAIHTQLGDKALPENLDDWPHWLPGIRFVSRVLEHWGTNPFGLKSTVNDPTETAP